MPATESSPSAVERAPFARLSFGPFTFDTRSRLLSREGQEVALPPRVIGVLELLDPQLVNVDTGRTLNVLGVVGDQLTAIIRLSKVYDGLGAALLHAAAEGVDEEGFERALHDLASRDDHSEVAALADTFHRLSILGPEAATLGRRILEDILDYQRSRP